MENIVTEINAFAFELWGELERAKIWWKADFIERVFGWKGAK